jgi:hypothetical protein
MLNTVLKASTVRLLRITLEGAVYVLQASFVHSGQLRLFLLLWVHTPNYRVQSKQLIVYLEHIPQLSNLQFVILAHLDRHVKAKECLLQVYVRLALIDRLNQLMEFLVSLVLKDIGQKIMGLENKVNV